MFNHPTVPRPRHVVVLTAAMLAACTPDSPRPADGSPPDGSDVLVMIDSGIRRDAQSTGDAVIMDAVNASDTVDAPETSVTPLDCRTVLAPDGFTAEIKDGFESLFTLQDGMSGAPCNPYPMTGSRLCIIAPRRAGYMSVRFTAPAPTAELSRSNLTWSESQYTLTGGDYGAVAISGYYATVSTCPGDFRTPPPRTSPPPGDPTFTELCRSIQTLPDGRTFQRLVIDLRFDGTGADTTCQLVPGQTYYFNLIPADPDGGFVPGEGCDNATIGRCGIQLSTQPSR